MSKKNNTFDIFRTPLNSRMLIEASAGTGKTYTLAGLYIRILYEKNIHPDQLLVVTFTKLATRELKERILNRLRESLAALVTGDSGGNEDLKRFIKKAKELNWDPARLRDSIRNFDDAKIYTIHGFCQHVLMEESLLTGFTEQVKVSRTDELLREAAEDYWRTFMDRFSNSDPGKLYISRVLDLCEGPQQLLKELSPLLYNPGAEIESAETRAPLQVFQEILDLKSDMKVLWQKERAEIISELIGSDVKYMTESNVESRAREMEQYLSESPYKRTGMDKLKFFLPGYFHENVKKSGNRVPEHRFFKLCEKYNEVTQQLPALMTRFLGDSAQKIAEYRKKKQAANQYYSYNDLLLKLEELLEDSVTGPNVADRLRTKFPAALVDEFQDTDPVQYNILQKIYPEKEQGTNLILIGDPKQSIYRFRGADLFAYLKARNDSGVSTYTLGTNFRSRPDLLRVVNHVFDREHKTPFLEPRISYKPVKAGHIANDRDLLLQGNPVKPFRIEYLEGLQNKAEARRQIYYSLTRQIVGLIEKGRQGKLEISVKQGDEPKLRPVEGRDIAILVNRHNEAEQIKDLLNEKGVDAVTYSREKVFDTTEARRLERLLKAVLFPFGPDSVQLALSSGFFGFRISELNRYNVDMEEQNKLIETLETIRQHWFLDGIYKGIRYLMYEKGALQSMAGRLNGERMITNVLQLAELAAAAEQNEELDPPALLRWFKTKISEPDESEEETLRLESDEQLVTISTIHNSKGLEFPIVFVPFLWDGRGYAHRRQTVEVYHSEDEPDRLTVNLVQGAGKQREYAEARAHFEEVSEEVRKTYVALTRAKYECRIFWATTQTSHLSGLGALLSGKEKIERAITGRLKIGKDPELKEEEFIRVFQDWGRDLPDQCIVRQMDEGDSWSRIPPLESDPVDLKVRKYNGSLIIRPGQQLYSYTSLRSYSEESDPEPDYDQLFGDSGAEIPEEEFTEPYLNIKQFPRGRKAGTFIHKLFESDKLDFRNSETFQTAVAEVSDRYEIEPAWQPALKQMLHDVIHADYPEFDLATLSPQMMLKEMEFYFPASEPDFERLKSTVRGDTEGETQAGRMKGFMNGYIDLVIRHEGRYFIVDYKSNYLGETDESYRVDALRQEMLKADYDIQYMLYTLSLKKYLENRDSEFDYQSHFGGICYLFLRGMKAGSDNGIYFHKPELEKITELEKCLAIYDESTPH